jgi:hypothetical protein
VTWVRLDDVTPLHPKLLDAGAEAAWLWVAGLAHCNRHATNGRISKHHLAALYPALGARADRLASKLVEVELWHDEGSCFVVHDYDEYQGEAMRDARDARKEAARERKRRQRERQRADTDDAGHAVTPRDRSRDGHADSHADTVTPVTPTRPGGVTVPRPDPSRPVPSTPLATLEGGHARVRETPVVSGSHLQEFSELLRAEAFASGYSASPRLVGTQLREAADRAREMAERTGDSYADAAGKLIRSALAAAKTTGKAVGLVLLDIEPSRPPPTRASGSISADRTRARATTHEDFKDAEPIEVQLERMRKRKEERRGNAQPNAL